MKPGLAAAVVSQIRIANAIPVMESVVALALAYSAKLADFPTFPRLTWIVTPSLVRATTPLWRSSLVTNSLSSHKSSRDSHLIE